MISVMLLSCFTIIVSAVPVYSNVLPSIQSRGGARRLQPVEAANQKPEAQTQPLIVEQPQPGVPQQLGPQSGPQPVPSMPYHTWSPQGNRLMTIPLQHSLHGPQLANQPTFQQGVFPSYGYFPMFSPQYRNQLPSSPYGFPMILEAPPPQRPANQPPIGQVLPAQTPSEAALPGGAAQPVQQLQQQNHQIVYMLHQPMSSPLGALSSEELEMAARMSQLGMYVPTMFANLPAGAVQSQATAGLTNLGQAGVAPTVVMASAGAPQTQGLAGTGPQPNATGGPVGLQREAQEVATAPTSVQPEVQPSQAKPSLNPCPHNS
ncbi:pollen-specific leucine-rich repeat extensin-like protein 2 [Hippoglossus hippoglossus]|uniref:pollen-specific leucine-rich repeat extensin-like protein 2 n=1 Tax=Hippoglossus hippoglossus TaxID=8267 RepID=UPI00148E8AA9|nr:pollen-specific leucine-rich repeat extensin-like protein 2 [Hippoglossus hippoglossus]